jgi:hypothetical protein
MDIIKLVDSSFSHSILGYCSDFQSSSNFRWERNEIDFNKIVDMNNKLNEIYSELQTCIDKVKIKYDYKYD